MQRAADAYEQIILSSEPPYRIVWASEAWLRLTEHQNETACGRTPEILQGPQTPPAAFAHLMNAIRGGQPATLTLISHTRSGRPFSHLLRVEPLKDSLGLVQCFQATSSEVQFKDEPPRSSPAEADAPAPPASPPRGAAAEALAQTPQADAESLEIGEMLDWLDAGSAQKPPAPSGQQPGLASSHVSQ